MVVIDSGVVQSRGEGTLREAGFPRQRISAHVDDRLDACRFEACNKRLEGQALVSECEDLIRHRWPVVMTSRVCPGERKESVNLPSTASRSIWPATSERCSSPGAEHVPIRAQHPN